MPDTPPATPRLTPAIRTPSHKPITMMKAPMDCPPSPPLTPPRSPTPSHQKPYMTMNDLFAMFARREKQSRKSSDTRHKRMRSPRSPMPGQAQITSYFKPASQPSNSPKSKAFTSSPCPAPRPCFPANRSAGTPQNSKATKPAKLSKSLEIHVFTSCPNSALRPYLPANGKPITSSQTANHIADLLQALRALLEQWAGAFAAPTDNGTPPPSAPPYGPMYSRRDDAERKGGIV